MFEDIGSYVSDAEQAAAAAIVAATAAEKDAAKQEENNKHHLININIHVDHMVDNKRSFGVDKDIMIQFNEGEGEDNVTITSDSSFRGSLKGLAKTIDTFVDMLMQQLKSAARASSFN
jgi:hypothetical protein